MRVIVTGATGQLGSDVCGVYDRAGCEVVALGHDAIEVERLENSRAALEKTRPQLLVNCAAMTGVEACEADPRRAYEVNAIGPRNLATLATELGFVLLQISTDYVFDGQKRTPYVETDPPHPLNEYGRSKLAGERFVLDGCARHFVVRTSGLFGRMPCRGKSGRNFVQQMLMLARQRSTVRVVDDEVVSPTHTLDVAEQLERLTRTDRYGTYHVTSQGSCSWYSFAARIFELADVRTELAFAAPGEFSGSVVRPRYSVLENAALQEAGLDGMPRWEDALRSYVSSLPARSTPGQAGGSA